MRGAGRRGRQEAAGLDDAVFGQVAELHVAESFPWAHHRDVCAETLHAGDVVAESECIKRSDEYRLSDTSVLLLGNRPKMSNKEKTYDRYILYMYIMCVCDIKSFWYLLVRHNFNQ